MFLIKLHYYIHVSILFVIYIAVLYCDNTIESTLGAIVLTALVTMGAYTR